MKTRIIVGAAMLLSLGSALAGGMIYQKEKSTSADEYEPAASAVGADEITPELIAKWKATSATADYSPPMLPI
jgi:hypothetical protein